MSTKKEENKKVKSTDKKAVVTEKSLYKVITVIDETEFKKFQKFYLNKFKNSLIPKIVMIILALLAIGLNFMKGNLDIVILVIIFIVFYPIILNFTLNIQIKKMYRTNKRINTLEEELNFYKDHFTSRSSHNYCKVKYSDIYKICETKSNFYIFISDNQSFIIVKKSLENCDSFKKFIVSKALYKKYR